MVLSWRSLPRNSTQYSLLTRTFLISKTSRISQLRSSCLNLFPTNSPCYCRSFPRSSKRLEIFSRVLLCALGYNKLLQPTPYRGAGTVRLLVPVPFALSTPVLSVVEGSKGLKLTPSSRAHMIAAVNCWNSTECVATDSLQVRGDSTVSKIIKESDKTVMPDLTPLRISGLFDLRFFCSPHNLCS